MGIFGIGLVCLLGCVLMSDDTKKEEVKESKKEFSIFATKTEKPKDLKDCSYEYARDHLSRGYYDNGECYDIAYRIRTEPYFRQSIEKSMEWGKSFGESVYEAIQEHGRK